MHQHQNDNFAAVRAAVLFLVFFANSKLQAQDAVEINGFVTAQESREWLSGVTVSIKGTAFKTVTLNDGSFRLRTREKFPFTLQFSSVGYAPLEVEVASLTSSLQVALATKTVLGNAVVVTASRVPESILRSPVAVEKLDIRAIKETPAPSFYDALENVKGVQMTTSSLTFKVPNTRGFNIPNNFRFLQLVDGVDMQAATLGVPLGNAIGPTELDIHSVEITPGAASALYGMNAINGMANLLTKNPFTTQGLSIYQKTAVNHIDGRDHTPGLLTETAIRFAKAFGNKFAFKTNLSYLSGTDWVSNSNVDQNPNHLATANPSFPELNQANAAYDAWNKYGDETNNAISIGGVTYNGGNKTVTVRRTGYWEKDLVQPVVDNPKADLTLLYKLGGKTELSYTYRFGKMDGVFQRGNKIQLDNVVVQNHRLELKGTNYFIRTYLSAENTGDSYNLKPLADNLQLTHLSDTEWSIRFKGALQNLINGGNDLATAMQAARAAADAGRAEPGTVAFTQLKNTIQKINNWDQANAGIVGAPATGGAWLKQQSRMYHTDAQYDFEERIRFVHVLVGADFRVYKVIPDGNNFVDFSRPVAERNAPLRDGSFGRNVYYTKWGGFVQATKTFFDQKLKLFASLRYDHNLEFAPTFNPRMAVVYSLAEKHHFRASYQNGFRYPSLFEALSFVNNGNVRRVGGLPFINEGLGYLENSYTLASVNAFNAAVNRGLNSGMPQTEAVVANRALLQASALSPTTPEQVESVEAGYKSVILDNKLVVDLDLYLNRYSGFLGQVEVVVPNTDRVGSDAAIDDMLATNRTRQSRYRVFTNAKNDYTNYGAALGITWNVYRRFLLAGNVSYNAIVAYKETDVFLTAFNTPNWSGNLTFGNRELFKNFGFNIVLRYQAAFDWESPLATGPIPAYHTVDAQVNYRFPKLGSTLKIGGSNLFNQRYIQYAAGPSIGGLYYAAITVEGLWKP